MLFNNAVVGNASAPLNAHVFLSNTTISFSTLRNRVNKPFTRDTNVMMKGATAVLVAGVGRMHEAMANSGADLRSDRGGSRYR
jgi:hypothetical protein